MGLHAQTETERAWLRKYFGQLKGATVTQVQILHEDGELWPRLTFKLKNGETAVCELSRDEEGNGPGFMHGLPLPGQAA